MIATILPGKARGRAMAPPSKSMAHRALLCGALSGGSRVIGVTDSKDMAATTHCLQAMGAKVEKGDNTVSLGGLNPLEIPEKAVLFCNESGSTLRFLIPLCMLAGKPVTLTGSTRLFQRPLGIYEQIAQQQGISWQQTENGVTVCGKLKSGDYTVPGDVSSQFITGLLYALPLLERDSTLEVTGKFESASYIDLTLAALKDFGICIIREGRKFRIPGNQKFRPREYAVEADCSNAAFLDALNLLGGQVQVTGLSPDTLQGDRVYQTMYRQLEEGTRQFDLSDCPDLGPVMFAMAAAKGGATFTGTARLRIKESDRGLAMAAELEKFGITVTVEENTVTVQPGGLQKPVQLLCGHNDHRIVMSLALLCTLTGGMIEGAEAVNKSFPDFFEKLKQLQIEVVEDETGKET